MCSSHEPTSETKVHVWARYRRSRRTNWLFTWLDLGGKRTASILTIIATCIAHDLNPRAYLHLVTKLVVQGWPNAKLRDLLPARILAAHPELYAGDPDALPTLMNAAIAIVMRGSRRSMSATCAMPPSPERGGLVQNPASVIWVTSRAM